MRLRIQIAAAGDPAVCIATLLVSDDPRDAGNARRKHRKAKEAGMQFVHRQFPGNAEQHEIEDAIDSLANDAAVNGIFVQLPLPKHLSVRSILDRIPFAKDIDGLSQRSLGALAQGHPLHAPATPSGILDLLAYDGLDVKTVRAVVVGRSLEIARATALLLVERETPSVTLIDPDATALRDVTREADVLVCAAERPRSITADFIKPGSTVVDAGYNRTSSGIVGDLDPSVEGVARAVVAMPGGIGPATIAALLQHTWTAYLAERTA